MRQHQRVIVHVNDFALGRYLLGDFVRVVRRGQARADVEELANPGVGGQVTDRAGEKAPGSASHDGDARENFLVLVTGLAVDSVVVFAA